MDESTTNVTLYAAFIIDVVKHYENRGTSVRDLLAMVEHLDRAEPLAWVSMELYNDVCTWIETTMGQASIRRAGYAIGDIVWETWTSMGINAEMKSAESILQGLKVAADTMIRDPKGRGWDVITDRPEERLIVMRRTQSFNCILQEGLLDSLMRRAAVVLPKISHAKCTRRGDDFCEYEVRWLRNKD